MEWTTHELTLIRHLILHLSCVSSLVSVMRGPVMKRLVLIHAPLFVPLTLVALHALYPLFVSLVVYQKTVKEGVHSVYPVLNGVIRDNSELDTKLLGHVPSCLSCAYVGGL